MGFIHCRPGPQACFDPVACTARIGIVDIGHLYSFRLQRLKHVLVQTVAAGADDYALSRVVAGIAAFHRREQADDLFAVFDQRGQCRIVMNRQSQTLTVIL